MCLKINHNNFHYVPLKKFCIAGKRVEGRVRPRRGHGGQEGGVYV